MHGQLGNELDGALYFSPKLGFESDGASCSSVLGSLLTWPKRTSTMLVRDSCTTPLKFQCREQIFASVSVPAWIMWHGSTALSSFHFKSHKTLLNSKPYTPFGPA